MSEPHDPVLATQDLTRVFGDIMAVDHLTLQVYPGEVFGFLGHNGAGKTTTVRLLNGVLAPTQGVARTLGLDPVTDGVRLRRRTGVLTENPSLDERLTGRENLEIYGDLYGVTSSEVQGRVQDLLETFELAERAGEKAGTYSKGMKQRLALARALLHRPELLFLDEPTAGLDPVATRRVHDLITRLSQEEKRTVLLCTHNLTEAQRLCDRVAVLQHGRLVALGTPADLARQYGHRLRMELEVAPDGLLVALDTLREALDPAALSHDNGMITVGGAHREAIPDLVAALVAAGVRIYRVSPQEASLEDVYFALTGEGGEER